MEVRPCVNLKTIVASELSAWMTPDRLEVEIARVVHLLESGERRATVRTAEGEMRCVLADGNLLIEFPNGTKKVRQVVTGRGKRCRG